MFNEIDFSKIDTGITPPQDDTERQYYYMAKLAEMVALREQGAGTADYLLSADVWVSDE